MTGLLGEIDWRRFVSLAIIGLIACLLAVRSPQTSDALWAQGPNGLPPQTCNFGSYNVYLSKAPPVTDDKYFTDTNVEIDAVAQVVQPVPGGTGCVPQLQDVPQVQWQLTSKPAGSSATIAQSGNFVGKVKMDIAGEYVVTFTSCPNGCHMLFPPNPPVDIEAYQTQTTLDAVDTLPIPPQTKPQLADLGQCQSGLPAYNVNSPNDPFDPCKTSPIPYDHADHSCDGGGGVLDPEWVTVQDWHNQSDYVQAEGQVTESHIAQEDDPFGHFSQDVDMAIDMDPSYRYLIDANTASPDDPNRFAMEWETDQFPEAYRPQPGDRVSAFGYWIHDCGHDYHTEIHPPVGIVVDKPRAIPIPASEGLGDNVVVPGIESDVFFNNDGGHITSCLSDVDLHNPRTEDTCLPLDADPSSGGYSPLARKYSYNIYLPQTPEAVLKAVGKQNPPHVKLYVAPAFSGAQPQIEFKQDAKGVGYLHVTIDLSSLPNGAHETYAGTIFAAWEYPSPDNWGLKKYQFSLNAMHVYDDSDVTCKTCGWGGDFHLWAVLNNQTEWTKILAGDDNEYDDHTDNFGGNAWQTAPTATGHVLGGPILLYPEQMIQFMLTGYEDDGTETSDGAGTVNSLIPQPTDDHSYEQNNYCQVLDPEIPWIAQSNCTSYRAYFEVIPLGAITPTLSADGQALYDASIVHASDLNSCHVHLLQIPCWDEEPTVKGDGWHPNGNHPVGPVNVSDFGAFEGQEPENKAWDEISPADLKGLLANASENKVNQFIQTWLGILQTRLKPDHPAMEMVELEAVLPPGKWDQYFGGMNFNWPIWGDPSCDGQVNAQDAILDLQAITYIGKVDCLNMGNVDCSSHYDVLDVLSLLKFSAGIHVPASPGCAGIGDKFHLTVNASTPTPTPHPSPTPTPTPTATPSATSTPPPTPTPSPTPDTTGPSITNTGANPDGNAPNWIYDHFDATFCTTDSTVISADVNDSSGLNYVKLFVNFTGGGNSQSGFHEVTVNNTGPGHYAATVNPTNFSDVSLNGQIQWFWQAQDTHGNITVSPSAGWNVTIVTGCNPIL